MTVSLTIATLLVNKGCAEGHGPYAGSVRVSLTNKLYSFLKLNRRVSKMDDTAFQVSP